MPKEKGLSGPQVRRILEDFQRLSMVFKMMKEQNAVCNKSMCHQLINLAVEEADAIHRDITGMLEGG